MGPPEVGKITVKNANNFNSQNNYLFSRKWHLILIFHDSNACILFLEKVAYVATGDAIRMANEIFGPNGWSSSVVSLQQDFVS